MSQNKLIVAVMLSTSLGCGVTSRQGVSDPWLLTGSSQSASLHVFSDAPYLASKVVCDPFTDPDAPLTHTTPLKPTGGEIRSRLYYIPPGQQTYNFVDDYIRNGIDTGLYVFMNQIHVPTRLFDRGFENMEGNTLALSNGETLMEWFALDLESTIGLTPSDPTGYYQLALLSDDGAILSIKDHLSANPEDAAWQELINNDGLTPTRMACAQKALPFAALDRIPIRMKYFQGPRMHIALTLMWRKVSAQTGAVLNDPLCGVAGNDTYFDSSQVPSAPRQAWRDLESRGWRALEPAHYKLPSNIRPSPCGD